MARKRPPLGKGGKREGSGRKPEWFTNKCKTLFEKRGLLEFVAGVASGTETEQKLVVIDEQTVLEEVRPQIKDRLKAVEMLKEWGFGKEILPVDAQGGFGYLIVQSSENDSGN